VSHAGLVLLRALADKTGLTAGLSRALATPRLLVHDRGRVLADLAAAIADGAEVISDFAVVRHQEQLFGPVASVPTTWRMLNEIAAGGPRAACRVSEPGSAPELQICRRPRISNGRLDDRDLVFDVRTDEASGGSDDAAVARGRGQGRRATGVAPPGRCAAQTSRAASPAAC
jgi:hypothetical protein